LRKHARLAMESTQMGRPPKQDGVQAAEGQELSKYHMGKKNKIVENGLKNQECCWGLYMYMIAISEHFQAM
jgi:hypothetical protein